MTFNKAAGPILQVALMNPHRKYTPKYFSPKNKNDTFIDFIDYTEQQKTVNKKYFGSTQKKSIFFRH